MVRPLERSTQLHRSLLPGLARQRRLKESVRRHATGVFVQEHFTKVHRPEPEVIVMNIHKAKGKQCDEVIVFKCCRSAGEVGNRVQPGSYRRRKCELRSGY